MEPSAKGFMLRACASDPAPFPSTELTPIERVGSKTGRGHLRQERTPPISAKSVDAAVTPAELVAAISEALPLRSRQADAPSHSEVQNEFADPSQCNPILRRAFV